MSLIRESGRVPMPGTGNSSGISSTGGMNQQADHEKKQCGSHQDLASVHRHVSVQLYVHFGNTPDCLVYHLI
jgi:hypothetical protein